MGCLKLTYYPETELKPVNAKKELTLKISSERLRSSYLFGFNGQEKDDEVAGAGNINTAMFWEYDTRLGRRWNLDPIVKPHESAYACFANNPIFLIDINGADTSFTDSETGLDDNAAREDFKSAYKIVTNKLSKIQGDIAPLLLKKESEKGLTKKETSKLENLQSELLKWEEAKSMFDDIMSPYTIRHNYSTNVNGLRKSTKGTTGDYGDYVSIRFPVGNIGSLFHESRHGWGVIKKEWNRTSAYDTQDELSAWNMQKLVDEESIYNFCHQVTLIIHKGDLTWDDVGIEFAINWAYKNNFQNEGGRKMEESSSQVCVEE